MPLDGTTFSPVSAVLHTLILCTSLFPCHFMLFAGLAWLNRSFLVTWYLQLPRKPPPYLSSIYHIYVLTLIAITSWQPNQTNFLFCDSDPSPRSRRGGTRSILVIIIPHLFPIILARTLLATSGARLPVRSKKLFVLGTQTQMVLYSWAKARLLLPLERIAHLKYPSALLTNVKTRDNKKENIEYILGWCI